MNIKKINFFFFLFFFVIFFRLAHAESLANNILFHDDFDDGNASGWQEYDGWGGWQVKQQEPGSSNFVYEGNVKLYGYPEDSAYTTAGNIEWDNYVFEVDIKGIKGVDKVIEFRHRSAEERYLLNIVSEWANGGNIINLFKLSPKHADHLHRISFINYPDRWYRLKVVIFNIDHNTTNIKLFIKDLDDSIDYGLVFEYTDNYYPITTGKIGLFIWPGGWDGIGSETITQYDNITISSLVPFPTSSPDPIILLPGLGASWNHEAIILGIYKEPKDWYMTPFVKTYDGLIQTLKNSGYEDAGDNQNLFIFNYDWRQPTEDIADQLENYIESIVDPAPETKLDLIGHSLGGMVARTYSQNNPGHQIDQLITLGSPHKGAPQIYYLWEGADLKLTLQAWQRIGAGILLHLHKRDFQNNVETMRNILPGLKDLLPTFPYLKQKSVEKPLNQMNQKNNWLENFNQLPLPDFLTSVLNNFVGLKGDTLRWINVKNRNSLDRFLGRWVDGKPVSEEFEMGDASVLAESAQLSGATVVELSGLDHGDLIESIEGQKAIIDLLGLSSSEIVPAPKVIYESSLIFQIASSANLTVFAPTGLVVATNEKLVFVPNPEEGKYQVQINQEDNGGNFRLLIGKIFSNGDVWQEFEGQTSNEPKIYNIFFDKNINNNKLDLLKLTKQKLESIRKKLLRSKCITKFYLTSIVNWRIRQTNAAINLLQKNKKDKAQIHIKKTILGIISLENNLKLWLIFYPPEFQEEIRRDLRLAEDYLLQAYEL